MQEITVKATSEHLQLVTQFVNVQLEKLGCSQRVLIQVDVMIDELFSNIVQYAYNLETGPVTVRVDVEDNPLCVIITFIDHGAPFDPLSHEFRDSTHLLAKERPIGGLGLFMVKRTMDDISYSHQNGQNILTIRKRI